jgi:Undecaprenyl-phosphate glucose phosphotransferase
MPITSVSPRPRASGFVALSPSLTSAVASLAQLYLDRRGNVSRPKLLATVALLDVCVVIAAERMAWWMAEVPHIGTWRAQLFAAVTACMILWALHQRWSYTVPSLRYARLQVSKVFVAVLAIFLALAGGCFAFDQKLWSPEIMAVWAGLSIWSILGLRVVTARIIARLTQSGRLVRRAVVVGGGEEGEAVIRALSGDGAGHLNILGVFDDRARSRKTSTPSGIAQLGTFEDLADFCQNEAVELLIVTVPLRAEERLLQILQRLFALRVDVRVSALGSKIRFNSDAYQYIGKVPVLAVMDKPLTDWDRLAKSVEDRVIGLALLVLLAPIMALVALAVRLDSKGPILFKQKRFGFDNDLIEVYKFRSMYVETQDATASKLVTRGDLRVTRVGRFIRRASLDELPQLFNVLRGEMSLVGPRPHATQAKAGGDLYQDVVHEYFARHRVKPGVTGWAQVNGWRGETDTSDKIKQRVAHDLEYIDRWSVLFDLYILALTPISLVSSKSAY